jgi:hypothetical protein
VYTFNAWTYRTITRSYRIALVSDTFLPLVDDVEQRVRPELPHANVALIFHGVAGERIHIACYTFAAMTTSGGGPLPQIELLLLGPDNKVIPATEQDARQCSTPDPRTPRVDGTAVDLALPASGDYLLMLDYSKVTLRTDSTLVRLHRTPAVG